MPTVTAEYLGDLRVSCTHTASGATIITDAPVDNHGKGQAFSPTDLCATSLAACAMTIMGIFAQAHGLDVTGTTIEVTKVMADEPRRIGEIRVVYAMPDKGYSDKDKKSLERAAHTCPVRLSLDPSVQQNVSFKWADEAK